MKDILIVAPTIRVYKNSLKAVENNEFENVEICRGILEDGLKEAEKFIEKGGKIIISRGGTYDLIKKFVSVPIIEIKVTIDDCIEAYNKLEKDDDNIGIIGFKNVTYGFEALNSFCKGGGEKNFVAMR